MYFTGTICIYTSMPANLQYEEPKGIFKSILVKLSGKKTTGFETETFSSIYILRKIYHILKALGINNVTRLSVDNTDFYVDVKNTKNDLDNVVMDYELQNDDIEANLFTKLTMKLSYINENINYLIKMKYSIGIKRGTTPFRLN